MVSTRSGRIISAETTSLGRITRSRAKRETEAIQEELAADYGQPEVTSPALPVNFFTSKAGAPSPAPFGGFGSPLAAFNGTPTQQDAFGTPFQERVVKTIGKSALKTPSARTNSAGGTAAVAVTPSAQEVRQVADVPLPDDGSDETAPFVSSEDEPVGPASPEKEHGVFEDPMGADERPARTGWNLLGIFTVSSLLMTALIPILLLPCLDGSLYAALDSRSYERVCQRLTHIRGDAADRIERLSVVFADRFDMLQQSLPPATLDAALTVLDQAWVPVQRAHTEAWTTVISPMVAQARQQVVPLWECAQPTLLGIYRDVVARVAPLLKDVLERFVSPQAQSAPSPGSIRCMDFGDLLAIVDQDIVHREYLQELWAKASRDVITKQKAPVWLLTCRDDAECTSAANAVSASAEKFIHVDGRSFGHVNAAGQLQRELVAFLQGYPEGLVLVAHPEKLHPNSLAVFANAASESGHLQMDGRPVSSHRALFLVLLQFSPDKPSTDMEVAAKNWLVRSISAMGSDQEHSAAVVLSFRRRVDAVLPVRKFAHVPQNSEVGPASMSATHGEAEATVAAQVQDVPPGSE